MAGETKTMFWILAATVVPAVIATFSLIPDWYPWSS